MITAVAKSCNIDYYIPMKKINLGDIIRSGHDTGEVCFVSGKTVIICVRMGEIALYDVKVVLNRTIHDIEILRKVDSDSLESVTADIKRKYMYNRVRSDQKWRIPYDLQIDREPVQSHSTLLRT